MKKKMSTDWLLGMLLCAYVFLLVSGHLWIFLQYGTARVATGTDNAYYYAMMHRIAEGNLLIGNTALKEHADTKSVSMYGAVPQGLLMRLFSVSIDEIALFGNIVFPLLIGMIFLFMLRNVLEERALVALGFLVLMGSFGAGILRPVNPQVTYIFIAMYLWLFLRKEKDETSSLLFRGIVIGCVVHVQIILAAYLLIIEGLDALLRLWKRPKISKWIKQEIMVAAPILLLFLPRLFLRGEDPAASTDALHRLGLISSHYPANPKLQLIVIAALTFVFFAKAHIPERKKWVAERMLLLLGAGLLALNQSVFHGMDVIFGLYYATIVKLVLWLVAIVSVSMVLPKKAAYGALTLCALFLLLGTSRELLMKRFELRDQTRFFDTTTFDWLNAQTGSLVIAAPEPIATLIPVYTDHFVLFNKTARYQYASDSELADRYLLQESLFPTMERDPTFNDVFGLYAGNVAARKRTACRLWNLLRSKDETCDTTIESQIIHQDVLARLQENDPNVDELLDAYSIDIILTSDTLPAEWNTHCERETIVSEYVVYRCATASSR